MRTYYMLVVYEPSWLAQVSARNWCSSAFCISNQANTI